MTVRRDDDAILLEDVCAVDDAEILMQELRAGAALIDWSACTHLHTACLQVILAAHIPMRGSPSNPALARWLTPLLHPGATPIRRLIIPEAETAYLMEA
jgi:hypothetical protein